MGGKKDINTACLGQAISQASRRRSPRFPMQFDGAVHAHRAFGSRGLVKIISQVFSSYFSVSSSSFLLLRFFFFFFFFVVVVVVFFVVDDTIAPIKFRLAISITIIFCWESNVQGHGTYLTQLSSLAFHLMIALGFFFLRKISCILVNCK